MTETIFYQVRQSGSSHSHPTSERGAVGRNYPESREWRRFRTLGAQPSLSNLHTNRNMQNFFCNLFFLQSKRYISFVQFHHCLRRKRGFSTIPISCSYSTKCRSSHHQSQFARRSYLNGQITSRTYAVLINPYHSPIVHQRLTRHRDNAPVDKDC